MLQTPVPTDCCRPLRLSVGMVCSLSSSYLLLCRKNTIKDWIHQIISTFSVPPCTDGSLCALLFRQPSVCNGGTQDTERTPLCSDKHLRRQPKQRPSAFMGVKGFHACTSAQTPPYATKNTRRRKKQGKKQEKPSFGFLRFLSADFKVFVIVTCSCLDGRQQ